MALKVQLLVKTSEKNSETGLEGRCLRETNSGSFSVTASATRRRGFNLSRAKQETTDSNTQLESRWLDRHIPTHIHTNTHTPTHHPRQVCLLCLCCTALHVFSQGQSERCPRSHQEKITLNVFRCLAATNNQTLKSHFPFTELLSLETFRSFYITWRQKHRDHSQDQM